MSFLIASIILIIIGSAYAVLLKRKLAETMFLAIVTVVLVLFCFGLTNALGSLLYGIYLIVALAASCIAFLAYRQHKERKAFKDAQLLQGCLLYAGLLALSLFFSYGQMISEWDEFSLWGTIVKHFFFADALGTVAHPNYQMSITTYLPGTSLLQYFFSKFSYQFIEHNMYIAMNMMYFCLIRPVRKDVLSKGKWIMQALLLAVLVVLPLMIWPRFYINLYVDGILGIFLGFSLIYYYLYKYEESIYGILMVTALASMLVLTKDMGFFLSLGVVGLILVDILFFRRRQVYGMITGKSGIFNKLVKILMMLLPLFGILFLRTAWTNLIARSGAIPGSEMPATASILSFFTNQLEPYQIESKQNFIRAISDRQIPQFFNMSVIDFSIVFIVVALVLVLLFRKKFGFLRMITVSMLLVVGLYAYMTALSISYVFAFSEYESVRLASYERYTASFFTGMVFFLLFFFASEQKTFNIAGLLKNVKVALPDKTRGIKEYLRFGRDITITAVVCLGVFAAIFAVASYGIRAAPRLLNHVQKFGQNTERPLTIAVKKWIPYFVSERPLLIDQQSQGFSYWELRYELMPHTGLANEWGDWSISTEPYFHDDPWTFIVTADEWEQYVLSNEIKLVYVLNTDEMLEDTFGRFFIGGVHSDMVYRVHNNDGVMTLIPVTEY